MTCGRVWRRTPFPVASVISDQSGTSREALLPACWPSCLAPECAV